MDKRAVVIPLVEAIHKPYLYRFSPNTMDVKAGMRVKVPLRSSQKDGYVLRVEDGDTSGLKEIIKTYPLPPVPSHVMEFLKWLSEYYVTPLGMVFSKAFPSFFMQGPREEKWYEYVEDPNPPIRSRKANDVLDYMRQNKQERAAVLHSLFPGHASSIRTLLKRGVIRIVYKESEEIPDRFMLNAPYTPKTLTRDQQQALDTVEPYIGETFKSFLLHGVTGSGKTEVYIRLTAVALQKKKTALILVPEIALTPQLAGRFKAALGSVVAVLHSGLTQTQRADIWYRALTGRIRVVVGVRSAIFAPLDNLGLIVVDEEHESTYKEEHGFRYHARDAAVVRGKLEGCPVVLGSATPSLESYYNASTGKYVYVSLPTRVLQQAMPSIEFVDLKYQGEEARQTLITSTLLEALKETLNRKEQALLFLNRKGFAPALLCKDCGRVIECPHCSTSLTVHTSPLRLVCHYCDYSIPMPQQCPYCGSKELVKVGVGLEKVIGELENRLGGARIERLDAESTSGMRLEGILKRFAKGEIDVIVGTQILAKGHDFPKVTLVAVLLAELTLGMPDFRAAERTFSLITQVAGRAGRGEAPGRVIIQTYQPHHYV